MMVLIIAFSIATSLPALNARCRWAWRDSDCRRGSITISLAPRFAAFLMKVAATGWLIVGLGPITMMTSASIAAANGADTAPEFRPSIQAEPGAPQLLEQIRLPVRSLGRAETGERFHALFVADFDQTLGGDIERFLP